MKAKKISAFIISFALSIMCASVMTVAEAADVARIGETQYDTLLDAFKEAKAGDKVELTGDLTLAAEDIDLRENIKIPAGVIFDGNDHTLTIEEVQDCDYAAIWSDGAYTVENITINVNGERENVRAILNVSKGGTIKNVKTWSTALDIAVIWDKPQDGMTLLIEDCEFTGGTYACYCDPNASEIDVTIKNNIIDTTRFGSMNHDEYIVGNILTSNCSKGLSIGNPYTGVITGNTFNGARALSVYGNQTITGNVFSADSFIELNNGAVADLSGNYWGGSEPKAEQIVPDGASSVVEFVVDSYYKDAEMTELVTLGASSVAEVNGTPYSTLEEAIAAANGGTVVLLKDLEQKDGVKITDKNVVIDLNGKTFKVTEGTSTNSRCFLVNGNSNVTIKNGTIIAAGDITSGTYGTVRTEGTANVTLDGLKLYSYRGYGLNVKVCTGTTVTISNTYIYAQYSGGIEAAGGNVVLNEGVQIEQTGIYSGAAWCSVAIGVNGGGKVVVNDGTYSAASIATDSNAAQGTWVAYVMSSGGVLEVNGGTFNGTVAEVANAANACGIICADAKAVVNINGGTFNSNGAIFDVRNNTGEYPNPSVKLAGGVFSADPTVSGLYSSNLITLADEYEVINKKGTYIVLKDVELPTATVTALDNDDLTFALNFKADAATATQLAYYGDWYADFVLTVNKDVTFNANGGADGYLSGQYDEWSENWISVPFENVSLTAGQSLKIMEYAAELMNKKGLKVTYADVYNDVKDFDCGVLFTDEFLAANPDLEVTLELRMYNPANEEESYVIGETYSFKPVVEEMKNNGVIINNLPLNDNGGYRMGIISGLTSLDCDYVGFEYHIAGLDFEEKFTQVYRSINTITAQGNKVSINKDLLNDGVSNYVFGLIINIQSQKNYTVKWRPFTEKDGKRIYGKYREKAFITK